MRVFVYYNLHKKVWSIKALEGESKGRVIRHAATLMLTDCTFKVSEAGRQRVLRERRKNVHAGVVGQLVDPIVMTDAAIAVTYNPYLYESFVISETTQSCHKADHVWFLDRGVRAQEPR
jgi:hypothetical protein